MSLKVLVLDGFDPINKHLSADTTTHVEVQLFRGTSEYTAQEPLLSFLRALQPYSYDLIIIGNNQGSGVTKAEAIPVALRPRAVVTWNDAPGGRVEAYRRLGYTHFVTRDKLLNYLDKRPQVYLR
jgi:hypothetical protein